MDLGTIPRLPSLLSGSNLIWFEPDTTDPTIGDWKMAPITDRSAPTTITTGVPSAHGVLADATTLYYSTQQDGIWSVPLSGGSPSQLVPGVTDEGMVLQGSYLYWLDFSSSMLERVPLTGGNVESLIQVFFGGFMIADASSLYWTDSSLHTVNRWQIGASSSTTLASGDTFASPAGLAVADNTVYWTDSAGCGALHTVGSDGSAGQVHVSGFDQARGVLVDGGHLYVSDYRHVYRVDR
jgi:hypothetical protein